MTMNQDIIAIIKDSLTHLVDDYNALALTLDMMWTELLWELDEANVLAASISGSLHVGYTSTLKH